ncbi:MAG TPA: hypothetical protein VIJ04_07395 [Xanthobacteraceae bacterium]
MVKYPDPTKDPEFQKVVQSFLTTKPAPHKAKRPKAKRKLGKRKERKE